VPLWVSVLEAAKGDPLRAQQIEKELTGYWWERWVLYQRESTKAEEERQRKAKLRAKSKGRRRR
jgi:hypothetical protein